MNIQNELEAFKKSLQTLDLREISNDGAKNVAFICIDMIEAFAGSGVRVGVWLGGWCFVL